MPFEGALAARIDPRFLADNANRDGERRLMYVALTRAERYLFVSASSAPDRRGVRRRSPFMAEVAGAVVGAGGLVNPDPAAVPILEQRPTAYARDFRLVTSFSDLRYFLDCPHDFYLRKVLGFAPTIVQAFGYGRGVHNVMRAIHENPARWAQLARDDARLRGELERVVESGLFYLRYTTAEPARRMRAKAVDIIGDYVRRYAGELARLTFEPERPFETLIADEQVLVSGAIDVIRLDDPPRVTLIDFKSGEAQSDIANKLDEDLMRLQVTLYGLAAKHELEFDPERGLVRYLGERDPAHAELAVDLDDAALAAARRTVVDVARRIRERRFQEGPDRPPHDPRHTVRCGECDFLSICGRPAAAGARTAGAPVAP